MKRLKSISIIILCLGILCMMVHFLMIPLADWVVRVVGLILLVDLVIAGYSITKDLI